MPGTDVLDGLWHNPPRTLRGRHLISLIFQMRNNELQKSGSKGQRKRECLRSRLSGRSSPRTLRSFWQREAPGRVSALLSGSHHASTTPVLIFLVVDRSSNASLAARAPARQWHAKATHVPCPCPGHWQAGLALQDLKPHKQEGFFYLFKHLDWPIKQH